MGVCCAIAGNQSRGVMSENAVSAAPPGKPGSGPERVVLVVDDEQGLRDLVCRTLRAEGYRTLEAAHGGGGLEVGGTGPGGSEPGGAGGGRPRRRWDAVGGRPPGGSRMALGPPWTAGSWDAGWE